MHQLCERQSELRFAAQSVRNQLPQMLSTQRPKRDLRYLSAGGFDGGKLLHQGMGDGDFVITIRANQDQMIHVRVRQQIFEQIECRCVEPLQVVEEERQWMFWTGEYVNKPSKY